MSKKKKKPDLAPGHKPSPPAAAPPPFIWTGRHTRIALGGILAASLLLGLAAIFQFMEAPFFNLPIIDEEAYVNWAIEISSGKYLGDKIFYQDPLYPYALSLLFDVFGVPEPGKRHAVWFAIRFFQALLATGAIYLTWLAAKRIGGEKAALFAAAAMASYRGLYFFVLQIEKATLTTFLSALSCLLGVLAAEKPERKWFFFGCGVSLGLLTLLRGNFIPILPLMVIWVFWAAREMPRSARLFRAALLAAGIACVIIPVSLRNYAVGGEFVITTSQGGANFYIGNNERANGRYATLPFVRANPQWEASDFKAEAEKRAGKSLKPTEVSRFWFQEAGKWIEANPQKALLLLFHKARLMIHQHEIPDNHSFYLTRDEFVPVFWLPVFGFGLLWGPALLGMWVLRRDRKASYPAAFAVFYCLSIIPFFIVDRYRTAVVPAMALFAGLFFHWALEKKKEVGWKGLWAYLLPFAAFLLLGFWPTTESRAPMGLEYYLLGNAYLKVEEPGKAVPWYDKAMKALPDNLDIRRNRAEAMRQLNSPEIESIMEEAARPDTPAARLIELGQGLEAKGQLRAAVAVYERAAAKDPNNFSAHARLGYLYATSQEVKDVSRGLLHLNRAIVIRPGDLDTMNALGIVNYLAGDTAAARGHWEEALRLNPNFKEARGNLDLLGSGGGPGPENKQGPGTRPGP